MRSLAMSTLTIAIAIILAVAVTSLPGDAADGSKALRNRVKSLERSLDALSSELADTRSELATALSDMETLQSDLTTAQTQLGDAVVNLAAAQDKLQYMTLSLEPINGVIGPHIIFTGCNVHIRSGSGTSVDGTYNINNQSIFSAVEPLGLGNLIIGYNEQPEPDGAERGGSHNLIIGPRHSFPKVCGVAIGQENQLTGPMTLVAGFNNQAQGYTSSVTGGYGNLASDDNASVSGGSGNTASGAGASVSGGLGNIASGANSSVSGGAQRSVVANEDWRAGSLFENN